MTLPEADVMRAFIGRGPAIESCEAPLRWICVYLAIDAEDADCTGGEAVMSDGRVIETVSSGAFGH